MYWYCPILVLTLPKGRGVESIPTMFSLVIPNKKSVSINNLVKCQISVRSNTISK